MTECNHLTTELQVVRGCLSGDGESARDFVNRFRQSVYQLCYRFLGNHEDCEDVMQDTFLRAFRSLHQWDQTRPLRPWLLAIASNRCKTTLAQRVTLRKRLQQQLAEKSACPERSPPVPRNWPRISNCAWQNSSRNYGPVSYCFIGNS